LVGDIYRGVLLVFIFGMVVGTVNVDYNLAKENVLN
jgi:hypothetical protein